MKIAMLIYYTFLRHMREYRVSTAFIVMPLVMIAILGAALHYDFTPRTVDAMKVGIVMGRDDDYAKALDTFLQSEQIAELMELYPFAELEEGISAVKRGEVESVIYLPKNSRENRSIEIYSNNDASIVYPVMESFVRINNITDIVLRHGGNLAYLQNVNEVIHETKIITEGKIPRGIDYYSIVTLFQFLIFGSIFGVFSITKDIGNHTYSRLQAAPVHWLQVIIGKYVGSVLALYLICILIFLGTKFVYQANWNTNVWLILTVLLLFTMTSISIGMLVALLTKSTTISTLVLFVVMFAFTLVAGGFSPMEGEVFEWLSQFSPNTYAHNILFSSIYDGVYDAQSMNLLILITICSTLITFAFGRRKFV